MDRLKEFWTSVAASGLMFVGVIGCGAIGCGAGFIPNICWSFTQVERSAGVGVGIGSPKGLLRGKNEFGI